MLLVNGLDAQLMFKDSSSERGILDNVVDFGFASGIAAFDYDQDGDIDIYVPQRFASPDRLYKNDGNGNFYDVAGTSGIDIFQASRAAHWFDYDNDGRVDLLLASDCFNSPDPNCGERKRLRLYRQLEDGDFQDVTSNVGLDTAFEKTFGHVGGICTGDVNQDGFLDLFVNFWEGESRLFMNDSGVFTDKTAESGISIPDTPTNPLQSVMCDFDQDGWVDIFTAVDFTANQLWKNVGNGEFIDVAEHAGVDFAFNEMGIALGDYDNDGDQDLFVTNIHEDGKHNLLLRNDSIQGSILFTESSFSAGVQDSSFGWGTTFLDANNDTLLDLAVTNGFFNGIGYQDQSCLFLQQDQKPGTFADVSEPTGFNDDFFGSCLIAADTDRDGDLDLLQVCIPALYDGPFRLLENQLYHKRDANWLVIRPRQAHFNRWCIGTKIVVESGNLLLTRFIHSGNSILGQEPAEAFFGLGKHQTVERVTVHWPDGDQSRWDNVSANQLFDTWDSDFNLDGSTDLLDVFVLADSFGQPENLQADLNHDNIVDDADVDLFIDSLLRSD